MKFPILQETAKYRDMTTVFGGYNHRISCQEGQFYDMKNMTSRYYPVLSPRQGRGTVKQFVNPQAILDKEDLWWIDDKTLYRNGNEVPLGDITLNDKSPKTIAKMGGYIVIMPDKVWLNTVEKNGKYECGYMENKVSKKGVSFCISEQSGKVIDWHDEQYYKDNPDKLIDGAYAMSVNANGQPSLKVYSATTKIWMTVTSTYTQIKADGIGKGFEKEDGIKISGILEDAKEQLENIFINDDGNGVYSTNTYIIDKTDDAITIPGIYKCKELLPPKDEEAQAISEGDETTEDAGPIESVFGVDYFEELELTIHRKVPDMEFITEAGNRLWGCSKDGHEIYACKLGNVKNWNLFKGISTDSWSATIGTDGKFTGAVTYMGYPMFFKEDGFVKIAIGTDGGHATKETMCRGVQNGSHMSLTVLNEVLYYKATNGICVYTGSLPYSISDDLGEDKYYDAVAGAIADKYYISMRDKNNVYSLFVYDAKNSIWCKEDNTKVIAFCRRSEDLYYIDATDNTMKSVGGTLLLDTTEKDTEDAVEWYVESGAIGYSSPDNKYLGRLNIRIGLEFGTNVDVFVQYDSKGEWEHKFNISGTGTRTHSVPIIPKRCDHFRYRIKGRGNCKIYSITKTVEQGGEG